MSNYEIVKLDIKDYHKCSNIWDMEKCPYTEEFKEQIINGNRFVYVYKINDSFIAEGALVINISDKDYFVPNKRVYLSRMLTKKEYRNQGIGSIILDYLIEQARLMGFSEISLGVDIDNYAALHLYKKKGFTTVIKECEDEYGKFYKLLKKL